MTVPLFSIATEIIFLKIEQFVILSRNEIEETKILRTRVEEGRRYHLFL